MVAQFYHLAFDTPNNLILVFLDLTLLKDMLDYVVAELVLD